MTTGPEDSTTHSTAHSTVDNTVDGTVGRDGITRVAMWSGPRNLSTALMRAWENRPDTIVLDEPLYAHYLARTGLDHPGRDEILAHGPVDVGEAVGRCLAPAPDGVTVVYQKHMSHHLLPGMDRAWIDGLRNFMLLRDPVQVLASYTRVRESVTLADIGLEQQLELAPRAELIIDADDFLTAPGDHLRAICGVLGLEFSERMLSWPAGRRDSDGCWAPYWYGSVEASTGFQSRPPLAGGTGHGATGDRPVDERIAVLPPHLRPLARDAVGIYDILAADRLVLTV